MSISVNINPSVNFIAMNPTDHLKAARIFAKTMDNQFQIMGIGIGIDSIIGLFPWVGDLLSMVLSFYLVWIGFQMKLPADRIGQMIMNIIVDTVIGYVPILGDVADVFYKANIKNLKILEDFAKSSNNGIIEGEILEQPAS